MKEIFAHIIQNRLWKDVPCGSGSTLGYTENLRTQLPEFLQRHAIESMLDLPCGDYSWMSLVQWPAGFQYQGADIVDSMIQQNQTLYPDVKFAILDICQDTLPSTDMVFCRDCLFHLSHRDIARALDNLANSDVHWLLTTTYPDAKVNIDISTGGFRPINLNLAPYNLPEPRDFLEDWIPGYDRRIMALWHINDVRSRPQ